MNYFVITLLSLFVASTATAARLGVRSGTTEGLPGYITYTFSLETEGGESLRGFDGRFDGPLNQVEPLGLATPFTDYNGVFDFVNALPEQDTQFLFQSNEVLSLGVTESSTQLQGAITGLAFLDLTSPTDFAQVVTDRPTDVSFDFAFDLGLGDPLSIQGACTLSLCTIPAYPHDPGPTEPGSSTRLFATAEPTPGLPGLQTYTVFVETPEAGSLRGLNVNFGGAMNQVNPAGVPTVLDDANPIFSLYGSNPKQDSQFLFSRDEILSVAQLTESMNEIDAAVIFDFDFDFPMRTPLAQIVTSDPRQIDFNASFFLDGVSDAVRRSGTLDQILIPEPPGRLLIIAVLSAWRLYPERRVRIW